MGRPPIPTFSNEEREELLKQDLTGRLNVRANFETNANGFEDATVPYITNLQDEHVKLAEVEEFLIKLASNQCEFLFDQQLIEANRRVFLFNRSGKELIKALAKISQHKEAFMVAHEGIAPSYHPRIVLFIEKFEWLVPIVLRRNAGKYFFDSLGDVDLFNKSVNEYREALKSDEVSVSLKKWRAQHIRNQEVLNTYIDELVERFDSLYVVHLHLGYNSHDKGKRLLTSYQRITNGIKSLFYAKNRNPMWKDDLVGHIWKVEYVQLFGFTARLILFYKGETAIKHEDDPSEIALRWMNKITEYRGVVLSREQKENRDLLMPENQGKLISKDDPGSVNELKRYVNFLLQIDNLFGLKGQSVNVFNRGYLPKKEE